MAFCPSPRCLFLTNVPFPGCYRVYDETLSTVFLARRGPDPPVRRLCSFGPASPDFRILTLNFLFSDQRYLDSHRLVGILKAPPECMLTLLSFLLLPFFFVSLCRPFFFFLVGPHEASAQRSTLLVSPILPVYDAPVPAFSLLCSTPADKLREILITSEHGFLELTFKVRSLLVP